MILERKVFDEFDNKRETLIRRKEKDLNIYIIEILHDEKGNVHILAKKEANGEYAIWTSYFTGELKTSYVDFYDGIYTYDVKEAVNEYMKRCGRVD